MKIRHGFVSNSSSSSFVVISKEPLSVIKPKYLNALDWKYVSVTTKGASYGRADITICRTIEDKLRHFTVLYAMYYAEDKDYFFKMDREGYNEFDIEDVFDEKGNVLYVMSVDDESAIRFAGDSKFSDFLEEK